jgi:lysophospholipase L1-like esterase
MKISRFLAIAGAAVATSGLASQHATAQVQPNLPWVGAWAEPTSNESAEDLPAGLSFSNRTIRQYVFTTIGGTAARLHFSNQYGATPVTISDVHIGRADAATGNILAGSDAAVTFSGNSSVTLAAGQSIVSDGIPVTVPARSYMAVSAFFPTQTQPTHITSHFFANQTMQSVAGDHSSAANLGNMLSLDSYYFLSNLDVQNSNAIGTLSMIGTSITDGMNSTPDQNHRASNFLAQRFANAGINVGVLNAGVPGGNLLTDNVEFFGDSILHRLGRDALDQPSIRWVILAEFSDYEADDPVPVSQLIAGVQTVISQSHARQVKTICSTLTPESFTASSAQELLRQQYNAFIRRANNGCDAVLDMDKVLRDPKNPLQVNPIYHGQDNVHPNDAGYQAIANAVPLDIFTKATPLATANSSNSCSSGLTAGHTLTTLFSCDGRFALNFLSTGVLQVTQHDAHGSHVLFASKTDKLGAVQAEMLPTGNFVLRDANGRQVWATNTDFNPGANLLMQNDGNLVIYSNNKPVWSSGTCCH